jgi:site-specific recombinase XerD
MTAPAVGSLVQSFFVDYLQVQKGLRPASVRSYRDVLRLFLCFVAQQARRKITKLTLEELSYEHVQQFLRHLEQDRHNHIRTRNHRLAAMRTFYEYLARLVNHQRATPIHPTERSSGRMTIPCSNGWSHSDNYVPEEMNPTSSMSPERAQRAHNEVRHISGIMCPGP